MLHAISRILWALATVGLVVGVAHLVDGVQAVGFWVLVVCFVLGLLGAGFDALSRITESVEHIEREVAGEG